MITLFFKLYFYVSESQEPNHDNEFVGWTSK